MTMRAILGGGLDAALDLAAGAVTHEVEALAARAVEQHIERRLRSLHRVLGTRAEFAEPGFAGAVTISRWRAA